MAESWIIFGASGHAASLAAVVGALGGTVQALCDGKFSTQGGPERPPILAEIACFQKNAPRLFADDDDAIEYALATNSNLAVGVGDNKIRSRIVAKILTDDRLAGCTRPLIAASATVSASAVLGPLTQVLEHSHVGPAARVGSGVIVNTGAIVEHEATVGDFAHIAPGAVLLGATTVGTLAFIGSGARILPGKSVGASTTLGAGAIAVQDLPLPTVYVGIPALPLSSTKGTTNA